jgi:Flp pilus assembly protein TadD
MIASLVLAFASAAELFEQGTVLFQSGRPAEAAARFEEAAKIAPKDARIWRALGAAYAAQENYERANEPFEKACTLAPDLEDACYYYGRSLYALNQFEPALTTLRKALRRDRRPFRVHLGIAQAAEALGRSEEAESEFRKSLNLFGALPASERGRPDFSPDLHYAVFLFRQGRLDEAMKMIRSVTETWPAYGRGHFEAGRILHHQGKLEEAAAELEKAVAGGHGAAAHLLLGRIYLRLGRTSEGQRHLQLGSQGVQ